jgi:hypothetical protein
MAQFCGRRVINSQQAAAEHHQVLIQFLLEAG